MVIVPRGWNEIADLVCGFGSREDFPSSGQLVTVKQVHGGEVVASEDVLTAAAEVSADGLTVTKPGLTAAIRTADCVPLLLVDEHARWAAVVHAGWRGTVAGIASVAVRCAEEFGVSPRRLRAAIGPSIGPCCYEVGDEVAARFEEAGLDVDNSAAKPRLDLRAINRALLIRAGVASARIQLCGPCTRCRRDLYWSFRADGDRAGRQLSWIGWADRTHDRGP